MSAHYEFTFYQELSDISDNVMNSYCGANHSNRGVIFSKNSHVSYLQFCPQRLQVQVVPGQQDLGLMLQLLEYMVHTGHLLV